MSVRDFFHGYGEVDTKGKLVSTMLVTETLKRDFRIQILEESQRHIKCKINRGIKITASPVRFPDSTLDIAMGSQTESSVITCRLTCYDYYVVAIGALLLGISCTTQERSLGEAFKIGLLVFAPTMLLFGGLVFLDTKYLMYRIRKALLRLTV